MYLEHPNLPPSWSSTAHVCFIVRFYSKCTWTTYDPSGRPIDRTIAIAQAACCSLAPLAQSNTNPEPYPETRSKFFTRRATGIQTHNQSFLKVDKQNKEFTEVFFSIAIVLVLCLPWVAIYIILGTPRRIRRLGR